MIIIFLIKILHIIIIEMKLRYKYEDEYTKIIKAINVVLTLKVVTTLNKCYFVDSS